MTDAEKKMKKYCNAVERRLNLPRDVKTRVMTDFQSSIQARRENGMSDEAIMDELGTPKQAAATLNEQMKEYAYRKSPWRFVLLVIGCCGLFELVGSFVAWLLYFAMSDPLVEASSIGIIGGADGPTAIFVTAKYPNLTGLLLPLFLAAVGIWGYLRLRKCKQK